MMTFQPAQYMPIGGTGQPNFGDSLQNMLLNFLKSRQMQQETKTAETKLQYLPQQLQAEILNKQLENKKMQEVMQYLGPQAAANLMNQQNINKYYAPNIQSEINERKTNTAYKQGELKYLPLNEYIKANESARLGNRFDIASKIISAVNAMPLPQKEQWMAQHADEWNQAINAMAANTGGQQGYVSPAIMKKYFPDINVQPQQGMPLGNAIQNHMQQAQQMQQAPQQQPQQEPFNLSNAVYKGLSNITGIPMGEHPELSQQIPQQVQPEQLAESMQAQPARPTFPTFEPGSKEQLQQQKDIGMMAANQNVTDPQIQTRATGAVALDKFIINNQDEFAPRINNALKYAGALGRGQKYADKLQAESPESYQDYVWYQSTFKPHMANLIKIQEHLSGTISQRAELHDMFDFIDRLDLSSSAAKNEINSAFKTLIKLSDSIYDAAEPINKGVYKRVYGIKDYKGDYLNDQKSSQESIKKVINGVTYHSLGNGKWGIE